MPGKQTKSVLSKLGAKADALVKKAKDTEIQHDTGGSMPTGVEGGIARVKDVKFDEYKTGAMKGKLYFRISAVALYPETTDAGKRVKGLYTSIMEPLCDTPTRSRTELQDHIDFVTSIMKMCGVDTSDWEGVDSMEEAAEQIKAAKPLISFRTWGGPDKKNPQGQVQHVWDEFTGEFDEEEGTVGGVEDDSAAPVDDEPEPEAEAEALDVKELKALGKKAVKDKDSQNKLSEIAESLGVDAEKIDTWPEVADAIIAAQEGGGDEGGGDDTETPADDWEPAKDEVYFYKPDPKKKAIECDVIHVDKKAKTVRLKNLDDGKTVYKDVAWDKLSTGS